MQNNQEYPYQIFNDPLKIFNAMLEDIENAKSEILIEVYKFNNDIIGVKFRDTLIKKAKEGVNVKILADSWGSTANEHFFEDLTKQGAEVRFFKKIKLLNDFFTESHRRNHRKIIIIDREILYTGSANISNHCLNWRELMVRAKSSIVNEFHHIFYSDFESYNKYSYKKGSFLKNIQHKEFTIIRDRPSIAQQNIMKQYVELIDNAEKSILIETPYFLPGSSLRKALIKAAKRNVKISIIMPLHSDVGIVDVLRSRYLGKLYENNIKILFYTINNLHSKLIFIDKQLFSIGSPNFDYRSFLYQHEITLIGSTQTISNQIRLHIKETLEGCIEFNYEDWLKRSAIQKVFEYILRPIRYYL